MPSNSPEDLIELSLIVGVKTLLEEGEYQVGSFTINVSYNFSLPHCGLENVPLGQRWATFFVVKWCDDGATIHDQLTRHAGNGDHLRSVLKALDKINQLFQAINLSWLGHAYSHGARTVGYDDVWMRYCHINKQLVPGLNMSSGFSPIQDNREQPTERVRPHIEGNTFPTARRFIRCFELIDHGFYTESLIISFSILDDLVQQMIETQLEIKGMSDEKQRVALLRGIKENRLKIYLGQLLYILVGKELDDLWSNASEALGWLNKVRNKIAHAGHTVDHGEASKAIYACVKTLSVLSLEGLIDFEMPVNMYRQAQIYASWADNRPNWVPPTDEKILDSGFGEVYPKQAG